MLDAKSCILTKVYVCKKITSYHTLSLYKISIKKYVNVMNIN